MDENESNKDIDRIVEKYKHHPSITAIKQTFPDLSLVLNLLRGKMY